MNKIVSVHYNSYVEAFNCIDKEKKVIADSIWKTVKQAKNI